MKVYICMKCNLAIPSNHMPKPMGCQAGGSHSWTIATYDGNTVPTANLKAWQCINCGMVLYSKNMPRPVHCAKGGTHVWIQMN